MLKPTIVSGEASETDSEIDTDGCNEEIDQPIIQGSIVPGEDSESENENEASISSATSALEDVNLSTPPKKEKSLLHQKLKLANLKAYNNIEEFYTSVISEAGRNLQDINQKLIKTQHSLQNTVISLKTTSENITKFNENFEYFSTTNFFGSLIKQQVNK